MFTAASGVEVLADGLSFPTGIAFAPDGTLYVAEAGLPWDGAPAGGKVWKLGPGKDRVPIAEGLRYPVNGIVWHDGHLYASEGGHPGRISRISPSGRRETVLDGLPGPGNYHTNMASFGPDGKLYFSQGAMTNSGIVGLDAFEIGWLKRLPHQHDIPGLEIELAGHNVTTEDPIAGGRASTGAFVPFGTSTRARQRIAAQLPCTAAILRCNPDGSALELVAWGLRNAYGLIFLADGRLLAIDQGADDRGSRPVGSAPDLLYEVRPGAWYGWPDFIGGQPISDPKFRPLRAERPRFLLANHAELPPPEPALLRFPPHSAATKGAVVPASHPAWAGQILVTLFGDEVPMTAPEGPKAGRTLARVNPSDWSLHPVAAPPLHRPIDLGYSPRDQRLCVLDFGLFEMDGPQGLQARAGSGRVVRFDPT